MAIGGIRLSRDAAIIVCGGTIAGLIAISVIDHKNPAVVVGLIFSIVPWFLVMRLIRRLAQRRDEAEQLVEELRESRAAHAESAALAERSRVARELHDVLAHSLSALALQLEGTRLLARDRDADPEVIDGLQRAPPPAGGAAAPGRAGRPPRCAAPRGRAPSGCATWPTRSRAPRSR